MSDKDMPARLSDFADEFPLPDPPHEPPTPPTLEQVIENLSVSIPLFADSPGPGCDACEVISYDAVFNAPRDGAFDIAKWTDQGWTHLTDRAGMIKRCATCSATRPNAWAHNVDIKRVAEWVLSRNSNEPWSTTELKRFVP